MLLLCYSTTSFRQLARSCYRSYQQTLHKLYVEDINMAHIRNLRAIIRTAEMCKNQLTCRMVEMNRIIARQPVVKMSTFDVSEDRYKGLHVNLENVSKDTTNEKILTLFKESLEEWTSRSPSAIWLKVPIHLSHVIPLAAEAGFTFHHAEGDTATLCQWMDKNMPSLLPQFATHQIGVAGCVVREDTRELLVVKDKNRKFSLWKFPGGLSDLGEDMSDTAEREVYEETGIRSEFQGILSFRQQHNQPGAFGRSDIFTICHMKPLSFELNPCATEIEACQWMELEELENCMSTSAITMRVLQLVKHGLEHGFNSVELVQDEFDSVYLGLKYKLFSRNVPGLPPIKNYLKHLAEMKDKVDQAS